MEPNTVVNSEVPIEHGTINNNAITAENFRNDEDETMTAKRRDEGRLSRCKCAIVLVIFLTAVVFVAYSITRLINANPNSTHKFYGPQFQTGWNHVRLTLDDAVSVTTTALKTGDMYGVAFDSSQQFKTALPAWPSTPSSVNPVLATSTKISMSDLYCPLDSTVAAPRSGLKLAGFSVAIGSDGLPVMTGQMQPFSVMFFRCNDIKCSSVRSTRLISTGNSEAKSPVETLDDTSNSFNTSTTMSTKTMNPMVFENLPFYGQTRVIITRTGLPLILASSTLGILSQYRCSTVSCDNVSLTRLMKNADSTSISMVLGPHGFAIISYIDIGRYPVVIACLDDGCVNFTKSSLMGIEVPSNSRLALHVTINGGLLLAVPGKWTGSVATELSFISPKVSEAESTKIFNLLKGTTILNTRGVVNSTFALNTPLPMLSTYDLDTLTLVTNKLIMLRGATFTTSARSLVQVQCGHLGCSSGDSRVVMPLPDIGNVTDVSITTSSSGAPLFVLLVRDSVELWGTSSSLLSFNCLDNSCLSAERNTIEQVFVLVDKIVSYTGQIVVKSHPYSTRPLIIIDHMGIPHVLRCVKSACQQVTVQTYSHLDTVCSAAPCFDVTVSPIDGMPILAMGTYPSLIHCANPYCSPYGS